MIRLADLETLGTCLWIQVSVLTDIPLLSRKIDSILSNKPEERRQIFEEAAGIVKYKKS